MTGSRNQNPKKSYQNERLGRGMSVGWDQMLGQGVLLANLICVVLGKIQFLMGYWTKGLTALLAVVQGSLQFLVMEASSQGSLQHGSGLLSKQVRRQERVHSLFIC